MNLESLGLQRALATRLARSTFPDFRGSDRGGQSVSLGSRPTRRARGAFLCVAGVGEGFKRVGERWEHQEDLLDASDLKHFQYTLVDTG